MFLVKVSVRVRINDKKLMSRDNILYFDPR